MHDVVKVLSSADPILDDPVRPVKAFFAQGCPGPSLAQQGFVFLLRLARYVDMTVVAAPTMILGTRVAYERSLS
jgi:hypothetical protein